MSVIPFRNYTPRIATTAFIAPDAWVIGDVELAEKTSVFFGVVIRGDINPIRVGKGTNLQEHALLHTSTGLGPCIVGEDVTVGHRAILHGCKVNDRCIIGMGSTILDGAEIGSDSIVGANALVPMNMKVPARSMVMGIPAKVIRTLTDTEVAQILESARHYQELGKYYRENIS